MVPVQEKVVLLEEGERINGILGEMPQPDKPLLPCKSGKKLAKEAGGCQGTCHCGEDSGSFCYELPAVHGIN